MFAKHIALIALGFGCLTAPAVAQQTAAEAQAAETEVIVTRAQAYPSQLPVFVRIRPARTGCTQLEMGAGIDAAECGTMPLHKVLQKMSADYPD